MKFITALGLAAGGASKTIGEGLDREETRKARISRELQAQNSINAQFKLYGQKREDEINDFLDAISNMQVTIVAQTRNVRLSELTNAVKKAKVTLEVINEFKQVISKDDLPQKAKQIVLSASAVTSTFMEPVLMSAPPMRVQDTCDQGFSEFCPLMLIVDEVVVNEGKQELRILETAPEANSWSIAVSDTGNLDLLAKQTRLETGKKKFLMQWIIQKKIKKIS